MRGEPPHSAGRCIPARVYVYRLGFVFKLQIPTKATRSRLFLSSSASGTPVKSRFNQRVVRFASKLWACQCLTRHRPRNSPEIILAYPHQKDRTVWSGRLTSGKNVVTTVRSANLRPASACRAFFADSVVSNLTKILPTPADCLLPPLGRGTFSATTSPNLAHSSFTSSQISGPCQQVTMQKRMCWLDTDPRSRHCQSVPRP